MGSHSTVWPETGDVSVLPTLIHRLASINPDKQTGSRGLQPGVTDKGMERAAVRSAETTSEKEAASCRAHWDVIRL